MLDPIGTEARKQMSEESRRQWIQEHLSRGEAHDVVGGIFQWLIARAKEDQILRRPLWWEPFAPSDRSLLAGAEGVSTLLSILAIERNDPEMNLRIDSADNIREIRNMGHTLLSEMHDVFLRAVASEPSPSMLAELRARRAHGAPTDDESLDALIREGRRQRENRSFFPGLPYLLDSVIDSGYQSPWRQDQILFQVSYTDTAATYLKALAHLLAWDEFGLPTRDRQSTDSSVRLDDHLDEHLSIVMDWLERSAKPVAGGGRGWGWAGSIDVGNGTRLDEVGLVRDLDADHCVPQTYFTAQVLGALARLYHVLTRERSALLPPVSVGTDRVGTLLRDAILGLCNMNRVGAGWFDVMPFSPSMSGEQGETVIVPPNFEAGVPQLLPTAYAVQALLDVPLLCNGSLRLEAAQVDMLKGAVNLLMAEVKALRPKGIAEIPHSIFLCRTVHGRLLSVPDDCALYAVFGAVASYVRFSQPDLENPLVENTDYPEAGALSDEQMQLFQGLARYILRENRSSLVDRRGFPAVGKLGENGVDLFPAIRASCRAVEALTRFGIRQMVPGINEILEATLSRARASIIHALVDHYGDLERRGIRVAWGLIEADSEQLKPDGHA
jgi:hypothetical protein